MFIFHPPFSSPSLQAILRKSVCVRGRKLYVSRKESEYIYVLEIWPWRLNVWNKGLVLKVPLTIWSLSISLIPSSELCVSLSFSSIVFSCFHFSLFKHTTVWARLLLTTIHWMSALWQILCVTLCWDYTSEQGRVSHHCENYGKYTLNKYCTNYCKIMWEKSRESTTCVK